jgi:site-specific DNA recombinase
MTIDQKDWLFIPVPPLIEPALFQAAQRQLNENRTRARMGTRRPGYLLQGLLICSECRYAYYGKTTRQRGAGALKDFTYYRCSGTDGYRFGGERICNNPQISGEFLEASVWTEVCKLLKNPQRLQQQHEQRLEIVRSPENLDALKSHLPRLQRGVERLIDSYSEGAIDKEQFMSRLSRTKARMAELEARIRSTPKELIMAGNCDCWWTISESLPTTLDVASRTQIGTEEGRSFAALLRELRSDVRASQSSSGRPIVSLSQRRIPSF